MPDPSSIEDQAVRYLLGELEGFEKSDFEARLAGSPELRALLQDLEAASDALALSAPLRRPPARVWQKIAREIESTPQPAPPARSTTEWAALIRSWFGRAGWAVATVVAFLWALRVPLPTTSQPGAIRAASDVSPASADSSNQPFVLASQNVAETRRPIPAQNTGTTATDSGRTEELLYLRQRIRELSAINQALSQQYALPPGAARFQVFRLTASNGPLSSLSPGPVSPLVTPVTEESTPSASDAVTLQNLLAQALARELAAVPTPVPANPSITANPSTGTPKPTDLSAQPTPPSESTPPASDLTATPPASPNSRKPESTPGTATDNGTTPETPSFAVVDLPTGNGNTSDASGAITSPGIPSRTPTNTSSNPSDTSSTPSALGVYSPETGVGSIAFVTAGELPPGSAYQFWVVNNQTFSAISLGTTTRSAERILVNFSLDPNLVFSPGFLVTIEPEGGSAFPSGPVVVAPPTPVTPTPAP